MTDIVHYLEENPDLISKLIVCEPSFKKAIKDYHTLSKLKAGEKASGKACGKADKKVVGLDKQSKKTFCDKLT